MSPREECVPDGSERGKVKAERERESERKRQRRETEQMSEFKVSALFNEVILAHSQLVTSSKIINTFISELSIMESGYQSIRAHRKCRTEETGCGGGGGGSRSVVVSLLK